jgi:hypothetical protein
MLLAKMFDILQGIIKRFFAQTPQAMYANTYIGYKEKHREEDTPLLFVCPDSFYHATKVSVF